MKKWRKEGERDAGGREVSQKRHLHCTTLEQVFDEGSRERVPFATGLHSSKETKKEPGLSGLNLTEAHLFPSDD